jgi:hypothetical protein
MNIQQVENLSPFEIFEKGIVLLEFLESLHDRTINHIHLFNDTSYIDQRFYDLPGEQGEASDLHKLLVQYRANEEGCYKDLTDAERLLYDKFTDLHWGTTVMYDDYDTHNSTNLSDIYVTYHFPTSNLYVKFEGDSSSYRGTTYRKKYEVKRKEKTITVYEYK